MDKASMPGIHAEVSLSSLQLSLSSLRAMGSEDIR
jgi:hypothetical protein